MRRVSLSSCTNTGGAPCNATFSSQSETLARGGRILRDRNGRQVSLSTKSLSTLRSTRRPQAKRGGSRFLRHDNEIWEKAVSSREIIHSFGSLFVKNLVSQRNPRFQKRVRVTWILKKSVSQLVITISLTCVVNTRRLSTVVKVPCANPIVWI